jgi:serine/threonine protein kinase
MYVYTSTYYTKHRKVYSKTGDLGRESTYVVLKVYISSPEKTYRERDIYTHLNSIKTPHPARRFIRKLLNHFIIAGPHGDEHVVLVHEVLGMSADELMKWLPRRAMSLSDMKPCIRQLLAVLDFLHNGAGIMHTGIFPNLHPMLEPERLIERGL